MDIVSKLERIWEQDKSYATRYALVVVSSVFIHCVLAIMFVISGYMEYAMLNVASLVLYFVWVLLFSRKRVTDGMLLMPYADVLVHVCVYNLLFGAQPAFYLYIFSIIPVMFFLSIRDARTKYAQEISVGLSVLGVMLLLGTLCGTPRAPFADEKLNKTFFEVNIILCAMLLGAYTWEFLTEAQNTQADLSRFAEYDQLTGLKNRYSLKRETQNIQGTQYCVVMCDIDDFKRVNDTFGHAAGDLLLSKIGKVLQGCLRKDDIVCRWGGEEFLLVIRTDIDTTCAAVERIRRKLSTVAVEAGDQSVSATMTFGIADCLEGETFEKVTAIADENLLRGKHLGKNCVITSRDDRRASVQEHQAPELDTSHLTGAVFAAFAATSDTTYIYICNLSTNVSRWSKAAVDYFGLPGEYMYDAGSIWLGFVHPEDRAMYAKDIEAVLSGRSRFHNVTYRARNKEGEYVTCVCKGVVTEGDATHPAMFAGTMTNLGPVSPNFEMGR